MSKNKKPQSSKKQEASLVRSSAAEYLTFVAASIEQLEKWLTVSSETEHLEFKEARNNFHFEKLVDYCVALANEGGGHIVFGVSDKPPRQVVGTTAFNPPAQTAGSVYERLHIKVIATELEYEGKRVVVFSVPSRPIGQPIEYKGRYLMRAGE